MEALCIILYRVYRSLYRLPNFIFILFLSISILGGSDDRPSRSSRRDGIVAIMPTPVSAFPSGAVPPSEDGGVVDGGFDAWATGSVAPRAAPDAMLFVGATVAVSCAASVGDGATVAAPAYSAMAASVRNVCGSLQATRKTQRKRKGTDG